MAFPGGGWANEYIEWLGEPGHEARVRAYMDEQMGCTHFALRYENERAEPLSDTVMNSCWTPNGVEQQRERLRDLWPELGQVPSIEALLAPYAPYGLRGERQHEKLVIVPPRGEQCFFLGPKLDEMAEVIRSDAGLSDYHRVLRRLLAMLVGQPQAGFRIQGTISPDEERPLYVWWKRRRKYEAGIPGKFVAYAGQSGGAYLNWSMRAARTHMERDHQRRMGITSIDGAQITLMNPGNRPRYIGCAGTERTVLGGQCFSGASSFLVYKNNLFLGYASTENRVSFHGTASFCLPKDER